MQLGSRTPMLVSLIVAMFALQPISNAVITTLGRRRRGGIARVWKERVQANTKWREEERDGQGPITRRFVHYRRGPVGDEPEKAAEPTTFGDESTRCCGVGHRQ